MPFQPGETGAADKIDRALHLNRVMTCGMLAMDAWLFDPDERYVIASLRLRLAHPPTS